MARKTNRRKVASEKSPPKSENDRHESKVEDCAASEFEARHRDFAKREVDRRIAAIKAICEAETENLLARLRLLRSYLSKEQLQCNAMQFFRENLPNVSATRNEKYHLYELQWNAAGGYGNFFGNQGNDISNLPTLGGLQFSVNSVKKNLSNAVNLQTADFMSDALREETIRGTSKMRKQGFVDEATSVLDLQARVVRPRPTSIAESIKTPGVTGNRLSFGMTPKTSRLPKNGEMLISVHGSPLGVYKEENLAAIHESGDGSHEDTS